MSKKIYFTKWAKFYKLTMLVTKILTLCCGKCNNTLETISSLSLATSVSDSFCPLATHSSQFTAFPLATSTPHS